jgi:enediyne biosynthesis thioesterase
VYFLTFFRWQQECRDRWFREERPDLWLEIKSGGRKLKIKNWETHFTDSFGATIGDQIEVVLSESLGECEDLSLSTEVFCTKGNTRLRIASGKMCHDLKGEATPIYADQIDHRGYRIIAEVPYRQSISTLDLLSWQGKCRELFLADHSPEVLRLVVGRQLLLQTSSASVDLWHPAPPEFDQVRIEMRLISIRCGKMTVQFEYYGSLDGSNWEHFATGKQEMSSKNASIRACTFPEELFLALREFAGCEKLLGSIDAILKYAPRH